MKKALNRISNFENYGLPNAAWAIPSACEAIPMRPASKVVFK